jgi:hypothetical protein
MESTIQTKLGLYAPIKQVKVINLTDLVPSEWEWFWEMLMVSNPDFSFGDNNLTLIHPERFALFIDDSFEWYSDGAPDACTQEDWQAFIDSIGELTANDIYINLEA